MSIIGDTFRKFERNDLKKEYVKLARDLQFCLIDAETQECLYTPRYKYKIYLYMFLETQEYGLAHREQYRHIHSCEDAKKALHLYKLNPQ